MPDVNYLLTNQLLNFKSDNSFTDKIGNLVHGRRLGDGIGDVGVNVIAGAVINLNLKILIIII
jgi:hypothetical protein